jgi:hypothetical protein
MQEVRNFKAGRQRRRFFFVPALTCNVLSGMICRAGKSI